MSENRTGIQYIYAVCVVLPKMTLAIHTMSVCLTIDLHHGSPYSGPLTGKEIKLPKEAFGYFADKRFTSPN